jgi:hypothetical protein
MTVMTEAASRVNPSCVLGSPGGGAVTVFEISSLCGGFEDLNKRYLYLYLT